jgi:hypothetical protein
MQRIVNFLQLFKADRLARELLPSEVRQAQFDRLASPAYKKRKQARNCHR